MVLRFIKGFQWMWNIWVALPLSHPSVHGNPHLSLYPPYYTGSQMYFVRIEYSLLNHKNSFSGSFYANILIYCLVLEFSVLVNIVMPQHLQAAHVYTESYLMRLHASNFKNGPVSSDLYIWHQSVFRV